MEELERRPPREPLPSEHHSASVAFGELLQSGVEGLERLGDAVSYELRQPTTAAAVAGGVTVGLGVLFGLAPTALAAGAAYVTYRILRRQSLH